ncbi:hypothetical protein RR48_08061 [Papilio machaon]|uniref:Uncharacterized protein n=1 Tax=Papilio machaon TaxID=76193 RepID=A0A194R3D9_PAPMA|nr:hypothetical protein RR48_08061 [Papilio machaon]
MMPKLLRNLVLPPIATCDTSLDSVSQEKINEKGSVIIKTIPPMSARAAAAAKRHARFLGAAQARSQA